MVKDRVLKGKLKREGNHDSVYWAIKGEVLFYETVNSVEVNLDTVLGDFEGKEVEIIIREAKN